jgi:hypothetical protein
MSTETGMALEVDVPAALFAALFLIVIVIAASVSHWARVLVSVVAILVPMVLVPLFVLGGIDGYVVNLVGPPVAAPMPVVNFLAVAGASGGAFTLFGVWGWRWIATRWREGTLIRPWNAG